MFMWAGIAFVAIVMVFMASSYDIKIKSLTSVNQQRYHLEQLGLGIISYAQKHAGIPADVSSIDSNVDDIDDYIKGFISENTKTTFNLDIEITTANNRKYTATASYNREDGDFSGVSGNATSVRMQKGDLIKVSITPTYEIFDNGGIEVIQGKPLTFTGKGHGYIKFKEEG